jgi:hypothetical protein
MIFPFLSTCRCTWRFETVHTIPEKIPMIHSVLQRIFSKTETVQDASLASLHRFGVFSFVFLQPGPLQANGLEWCRLIPHVKDPSGVVAGRFRTKHFS